MLRNVSSTELIVLVVVLLVLFGGKKLNDIARGLGQSQKEFEKVKKEYEGVLTQEQPEETQPENTTASENVQTPEDSNSQKGGGLNA